MSITLWNKRNGDELIMATTDLILTHCWCGMPVGVPAPLYHYAKRHSEQGIYCPIGHSFVFNDAIDKQNEQLKNSLARVRAQKDQLEASERAQRAAKTRFKNERDRLKTRAKAGVCPCCNRTFKQLAAHMKTKHPEFNQPND